MILNYFDQKYFAFAVFILVRDSCDLNINVSYKVVKY